MTPQEKLDEALAARHALLVGKARVSVGFGDRRVEYTAAALPQLDAYIAELRREIAGASAAPTRNRIRYLTPG